ncbi:MAG: ATP phosphoribosyltransferase regulatory subunit [Actinomycetota bacterium]|nr:ATP phosphoribosyltransferase regulatory subunit [Actinomycetota bacterium]
MRDFLPEDKARREGVLSSIRTSFAAFGYREIETPVAEDLRRLESGQGGDNEKLIYKVLKRGLAPDVAVEPGEAVDLGLRFDLTVPLARFYATHRAELPDVFRSIQIAPVWRAERPQKGRYRQFTQCDIDVLGEPSNLAEIELITATAAAIDGLGIEGTSVRINDRRVLLGLLDDCGYEPAARAGALVIIDKLDKIGIDGVGAELAAAGAGLPDRLVAVLEATVAAAGGGGAGVFDATLAALPPSASEAAGDLRDIKVGVAVAAPEVNLVADPTLVRGMGYYTGPIFELSHPSLSASVGGGGRYDGMIGRFAGRDVAGCGFSIGFERIVDLVDEGRMAPGRRRLAVLHDGGSDPGVVVAWQRRLIAEDADVRIVRRIRNHSRLLDQLAAEGFSAYLDLATVVKPPGQGEPLPGLSAIRPVRGVR